MRGRSPFILNKKNIQNKLSAKIFENKERLINYQSEEFNAGINLLNNIDRVKTNLKRE